MTTLKLTKKQLATLQANREHVDTDDGTVFVGVRGRRHKDGLWHVDVIRRELSETEVLPSFSMNAALGTNWSEKAEVSEPLSESLDELKPNSSGY